MNKITAALLVTGALAPALALAQTTPGMTASHARSAMTDFGCNGISGMTMQPDGAYHAQCTKGGKVINAKMDSTGKVSEAASISHVTEGQARYSLTAFGCATISDLGSGPGGTWHGQCYKGGAPINVMVDAKGVASVGTAQHVTEGAARSMLTNFGCGNISSLTMGQDGTWSGQCAKGGRTQNVTVDKAGKMAAS